MGVADNKSYKDMRHFNTGFYGNLTLQDVPSIKGDPEINSTIKENPYSANVEIEGGEMVLDPSLTSLFKATGKKHSKGGMDVQLKPDSFIFSDDPSLSFTDEDHKMYELKDGKKSTPAEVLKRNIDAKHYNTMISIMNDPRKTDLEKNTASKMLEKYIGTLGNIAFIQEQKKGLPTGMPSFSQGTAPVYDDELKDEIMAQKQYLKKGGPVFDVGGPYYGRGSKSLQDKWYKQASALGYSGQNDIYGIQSYFANNYPDLVTNMMSLPGMGQTNYGKKLFGNKPSYTSQELLAGFPDRKLDRRILDVVGVDRIEDKQNLPSVQSNGKTFYRSGDTNPFYLYENPTKQSPSQSSPYTEDSGYGLERSIEDPIIEKNQGLGEVNPETGKMIDWQMTPYQKLSQLYNGSQWASVKRYMPMRSQMRASYIDPQLVNPEQTVGDVRGTMNAQINALSSLSPIMRGAQSSEAYGQYLDKVPGIRSQYDNQNAQIVNQARQYNNQIRNNTTAQNMQNDANYYQQSITGQQNFDNMKNFKSDQWMNNLMGDVQTNQALAYEMATMKNPAYRFDFKTGNYIRNPKSILDVQNDPKSDLYTSIGQSIAQKMKSGQTPTKEEIEFFKALSLGKLQFTPQKMGGKLSKFRGK